MAAEYDQCEDCLGTGGHRDEHGEGDCGTCGGSGRNPANEAARKEVSGRISQREAAIWKMVTREMDKDR